MYYILFFLLLVSVEFSKCALNIKLDESGDIQATYYDLAQKWRYFSSICVIKTIGVDQYRALVTKNEKEWIDYLDEKTWEGVDEREKVGICAKIEEIKQQTRNYELEMCGSEIKPSKRE